MRDPFTFKKLPFEPRLEPSLPFAPNLETTMANSEQGPLLLSALLFLLRLPRYSFLDEVSEFDENTYTDSQAFTRLHWPLAQTFLFHLRAAGVSAHSIPMNHTTSVSG